MEILIYGSGAVGLGLASCLIKSGAAVTLLARPKTAKALKRNGLRRSGIFGNSHASPKKFSCFSSLAQIKGKSFDFILVSTKSFDSPAAAKDLKKYRGLFHLGTRIILCQNGWGNAEVFAKYFPRKNIYNARIITGFYRPQPHHVTITVHADPILIGSLFGSSLQDVQPVCDCVAQGGIPCQISPDIGKDIWTKMFYNCALNSLGAILDVPYGLLGQHPFSRELMGQIIAEAFDVMKKAGYKTHWPSAKAYLKFFYAKSLPLTAQHHSSTLRDLKAGKRTEIDALNGIVVSLGEKLGVPTPVNRTVYRLFKFIEWKNAPKE